MKDEFVSTVSHELRTPLTSIRAFSEILQDDVNMDPQQRQQLLRIVVKETERLTRLVNQVLDFTKIESGSYQWVHEKLDLVSVVQEAAAATSQLSQNKNISITRESPPGPVLIFGDNDRLVQVLINLLSNAIKYCAQDTGKVHIRLSCTDDKARIEVVDNGPGIEPDERERIFERFHQLGDSSKVKPHGTGLGLAICKTIIENHNGRIWVESNQWNGSSFTFTLPLLADSDKPSDHPLLDKTPSD
jgi:signal transduction histidine kinase